MADANETLAQEDAEMAQSRTLSDRQGAARAAEEKAIRGKRMKQTMEPDSGGTKITVTKFGDGKVSTGVHLIGTGDVMAKKGDMLSVSADVADELEHRGFAERVE